MKKNVIIIGGGFAGLTAATELISSGYNVTVIEQRGYFGGRAFSFLDRNTFIELDNGQHLLMGCYENTFRFLKTLGTFDKLYIQKNLHVDFIESAGQTYSLSCLPLPAPLHAASGILRFKALSLSERLKMLYITKDVLYDNHPLPLTLSQKGMVSSYLSNDSANDSANDSGKGEGVSSITDWLSRYGQGKRAMDTFWNILTLAIMNESPDRSSAAIFKTVLRKAMFKSRKGSRIVFPAVPLSRLYADDAEDYVIRHGGVVEKRCAASEILFDGHSVTGIRTRNNRIIKGDYYISAVPYYSLHRLLPPSIINKHHSYFSCLKELKSSPIISFHLLFDKPIIDKPFAAFINSPVQWIFNNNMISTYIPPPLTGGGQGEGEHRQSNNLISLVISGAQEFVNMDSAALLTMAVTELRKFLPEANSAKLIYSRIIKEKSATFIPAPDIQKYRPSQESPIKNLFIAGDWTDTGLPATIEGAVLSGYRCAELIRMNSHEPSAHKGT
ncbi:MAG: FAD-dependent oxidoreductase [Nitrospirae bacterium]|nr:FAD-dependent oxidoreductase [Nitrospirota bacterium]